MLARLRTVAGHSLWLIDYHTTVIRRNAKARAV
jgi:hypothetical protein